MMIFLCDLMGQGYTLFYYNKEPVRLLGALGGP